MARAQEPLAQGQGERPIAPSAPSHAASPGLQLGARLGYTLGTGSVYSGLGVADASSGALPIIVDVGWRALRELYVGVYGQFAPVLLRRNVQSCREGFDCSARNWRFGLQADIHFMPRSRFDPYVGIGGGYEILHTTVSGPVPVPLPSGVAPGRLESSVVDRGWEFANLTLGFDYRVSDMLGIGPFAAATLAKYNVRETDRTVTVAGSEIPSVAGPVTHATHEQYIFGVRGTFNP